MVKIKNLLNKKMEDNKVATIIFKLCIIIIIGLGIYMSLILIEAIKDEPSTMVTLLQKFRDLFFIL